MVKALAAAAEDWKSMKQYPALLLSSARIIIEPTGPILLLAYPENLSRIIFTLVGSPMDIHVVRIKFSSIQGSSSPILSDVIVSDNPLSDSHKPASVVELRP